MIMGVPYDAEIAYLESNGVRIDIPSGMIPVRVGPCTNAVGYIFDRATRKLIGATGGSTFVLGPDVAKPVMGLRKFTPTARNYVQDGLVAMWDGIENAGWGVHNANATVWKDLVGTRDATLSGSYSWGSKYWDVQSVSGRGIATWDGTSLPNSQTWEIVIHPYSNNPYGRIIAEGQGVASPLISSTVNLNRVGIFGYNKDSSQEVPGLDVYKLHVHTIVHPTGGPMIYYIDATDVWTLETASDSLGATYGYFANRGSDFARGLDAKYYSVRLYSRALTASEIAANYAIDKIRFNLPD